MFEKQSKRQELLALLKDNPLTAKELVEQLDIPIEHVRTYISQFPKEIIKSGKKGKYNLYEVVEIELVDSLELLKQLYDFMSDEKKCKIMNFEEKDLELIQTIKELVK